MPKKQPIRKLSKGDVESVLYTLETLFKDMSKDEQKAVLKKIGVSKTDIESLDETGLVAKIRSSYKTIVEDVDLNNFRIHSKYKTGAEFLSKKHKEQLKTEIENYKKL